MSSSAIGRVLGRAKIFRRDESGTMIIFGLTIFVMMLWAGGMAIDFMRFENERIKMQYTLDRALLAAAALENPLDPQDVVNDYFAKSGLSNATPVIEPVEQGLTYKRVSASVSTTVKSLFVNLMGIETMSASARGTAEERLNNVEVSLVLDISGSMGRNSYDGTESKLDALKRAAKGFLGDMLTEENKGRVSVNIIPYAMQTTVGPDVLDQLNVTDEHEYSHCIDFNGDDFTTTQISRDVAVSGGGVSLGPLGEALVDDFSTVMGGAPDLQRTGHFDVFYTTLDHPNTDEDDGVRRHWVCPTEASKEVRLMSQDLDALSKYIDGLEHGGNTSTDIGVKWGSFFLDPTARAMLKDLPKDASVLMGTDQAKDELGNPIFDDAGLAVKAGGIDEAFNDRPKSFQDEETIKILIVMTDGVNTTQFTLDDKYASGDSTLWLDPDSTWLSHYKERSGWNNDYFMSNQGDATTDYFSGSRYNHGNDERLSWPEVWNMMGVKFFAYYFNYARDWDASEYHSTRAAVTNFVRSSDKDVRTENACQAAKDQEVIVFTIGYEVSDHSAGVMERCASSTSNFFRVKGKEIDYAFGSIAKTIQRLKLTN